MKRMSQTKRNVYFECYCIYDYYYNKMCHMRSQAHCRGGSRISSQGGAHLKKLRRAKGGAKIFGVFRVKNHDFTTKKSYFSNFRGAREIFGVFHVKNHDFTPKKSYFFNQFQGGRAPGAPPPESAPALCFYVQSLECLCISEKSPIIEIMNSCNLHFYTYMQILYKTYF